MNLALFPNATQAADAFRTVHAPTVYDTRVELVAGAPVFIATYRWGAFAAIARVTLEEEQRPREIVEEFNALAVFVERHKPAGVPSWLKSKGRQPVTA